MVQWVPWDITLRLPLIDVLVASAGLEVLQTKRTPARRGRLPMKSAIGVDHQFFLIDLPDGSTNTVVASLGVILQIPEKNRPPVYRYDDLMDLCMQSRRFDVVRVHELSMQDGIPHINTVEVVYTDQVEEAYLIEVPLPPNGGSYFPPTD